MLAVPSQAGKDSAIRQHGLLNIAGKVRFGGERARVYFPDTICPALSATDYKQPVQVLWELADERA